MSNKNITLSLVLIGLLVVAVLVKVGLFNNRDKTIIKGEVDKFCLNDFCLEKKDNKWRVIDKNGENEAKAEMVKIYVDKFKIMEWVDLVSTKPEKLSNYGMGGDKKLILKINGEQLEIGSVGGDLAQTYIRRENENRIYTTNVNLDKQIFREKDFWLLNR